MVTFGDCEHAQGHKCRILPCSRYSYAFESNETEEDKLKMRVVVSRPEFEGLYTPRYGLEDVPENATEKRGGDSKTYRSL